jgi:AAA+ superfamily predicted ATPase
MSENWTEKNQKYLVAQVAEVKALLKNYIALINGEKLQPAESASTQNYSGEQPAVETLGKLFGLSQFEKHVLVLCAAAELDSEVKFLLAQAQGNPNLPYPTFGLALAFLPNPHWSALSPVSPLRRFRLLEASPNASATSITSSPLHIAERVLHYLTGVFYLDTQLQGLIKPAPHADMLVESHKRIIVKILAAWQDAKAKLPLIQLYGPDEAGKLAIAQQACAQTGLSLWTLPAELIPQKAEEAQALAELWTREAALIRAGLFVSAEETEAAMQRTILRFIDNLASPVFLGSRIRWLQEISPRVLLEVNKPLRKEQRLLWQSSMAGQSSDLDSVFDALVGQFDLSMLAIQSAAHEAALLRKEGMNLPDSLWRAACEVSRPRISELAQRIIPKATMDGLVLPEREKQLLKELAFHIVQRHKVYSEWGFESASGRGLGITALFSGPSGTGKTMAAEVIANQLRLDLFRIDLSAVVSKYIGETEKNLRKLFDAAEDGGAVLFFDEADALFGKRTEVKDSHDRYANIEVNYLLQRMENYRGLAILATNMREALDQAFVRRLKFIVNFPFPDEKSRGEIWRHIFPEETPTERLDFDRLSKLNIAGGNIRNIALYSAFIAANEGVAVNMRHLKRAVQVEYAKMERPLTQTEVGDW